MVIRVPDLGGPRMVELGGVVFVVAGDHPRDRKIDDPRDKLTTHANFPLRAKAHPVISHRDDQGR